MDPFAALADPTRRRLLELLAAGERGAGDLTAEIRADGPRRLYSTDPAGLALVAAWVDHVTPTLAPRLDALATEVARGRRERRTSRPTVPPATLAAPVAPDVSATDPQAS